MSQALTFPLATWKTWCPGTRKCLFSHFILFEELFSLYLEGLFVQWDFLAHIPSLFDRQNQQAPNLSYSMMFAFPSMLWGFSSHVNLLKKASLINFYLWT